MMTGTNPLPTSASTMSCSLEETRLLVFASSWKDGHVASQVLRDAQIDCMVCNDIGELIAELGLGAGALLLVEEVLTPDALLLLENYISHQPDWSDLASLVLTYHGASSPY